MTSMTLPADPARVRAEAALRASEERLRHLVEHAQDVIYCCDAQGNFTYVNPAAARLMKYHADELLGRHFLEIIHPDHHERAGRLYARQFLERLPSTYLEFAAVTKSGDTVWIGQHVQLIAEGGAVAGVQAIARDITPQKDAEERLRRSEAKYRSLIQGAAYGIYRSTFEGRILDANPAFVQMLGYGSVEEVTALNMADVYRVAADREQIIERYKPERGGAAEVEWKRKDGTPITVCLSARVVDFEADGLSCFEGVVEDVTAKRTLEAQLREAQKMEAIGVLARGVAHDFNNVLAAILGCSNLLVSHLEPGHPARDDAAEIGKAVARGAWLTRQLLDFSRPRAVDMPATDLGAVVRGLEQMLQRVVGEAITLQIDTREPAPVVRAEPGQIEQMVMNLVVNARDAMPRGGRIDIVVEVRDPDPHAAIVYPGGQPARTARIAVHDTGTGIAASAQPHVFEPFFTTKEPSKGTGLGLSIVYGIAKEAGGTVLFSTVPDAGTTFEILIPLAAGSARPGDLPATRGSVRRVE
jgi:two-component system cell cycle sensor histidine kinase/response regulator CckA